MRALVVGADGFAGRWLCRHLAESGDAVHAVVGPHAGAAVDRAAVDGAAVLTQLDVRDTDAIGQVVATAKPDAIYYLAAVSRSVGREQVADAVGVSVIGSAHTLVAAMQAERPCRFLHVSSSHVYDSAAPLPLTEGSAVLPWSVYGAAKAASEAALTHLARASSVDVIVARPFNHIGPGQSAQFLAPALARQVAQLRDIGHGRVIVGDPSIVRDFTDVRDVVRAYRLLADRGEPGAVYNVCSGAGTSVGELVEILMSIAGDVADVDVDPTRAHGREPASMVGDPTRLEQLGWKPTLTLRQTLHDILAEARDRS